MHLQCGIHIVCVSPILFVIAVELMALMVRNNMNIEGVTINKTEYKISQFADDATCFVQSAESAEAMLDTLGHFAKFSGLHLNMEKSLALPIGPHIHPPANVGGLNCGTKMKILGVWFSNSRSQAEHFSWNFLPQLQKMKDTCKAWSNRTLSYKGKVTVFNVLVVSLLQYVVTNSQTPKRVLAEVKKIACDYFWSGKRSRIAYDTIIQDTRHGGLRLMDLEARVKVCLLSWVKRIVLSPGSTADNIIRVFCGEVNPTLIWAAKRDFSGSLSQVSPFYAQVLKVWQEHHNTPPKGEPGFRKEIIWNNPRIPSFSASRSRSRWDRWIEADIMTVGQLCHPSENRLLGQQEIEDAYSIKPTFLEALAIRNSIPVQWRRALTRNFEGSSSVTYALEINDQEFDLLNSTPKAWYGAVIAGKKRLIKRQLSWVNELSRPNSPVEVDWAATYALPFKISRETKLQSFHYRIVHRIITCNKYLHDIRLRDNDKCETCGETDSISHFFVSCPAVETFWEKLSLWCEEQLGLGLSFLTEKEMVLGMTDENGNPRTFKVINWLLLTAKFFLHRQKLFHGEGDWANCLLGRDGEQALN